MTFFLVNIAILLGWCLLVGSFDPLNIVGGFLIGFVVLFVSSGVFPRTGYFRKVPQAIGLTLFVLWELIVASSRLLFDILTPQDLSTPKVIAVPLDARSDAEITLLANLISLTPGTVTVDVAEARDELFVHAMYAEDEAEVIAQIKRGLERRILRLLR